MLCITNNSVKHQSFVYTQLNDQTDLFQTIQFGICHLFALSLNVKQFYSTHRYSTLSDVTNPDQSGPGSDGNEGVLCIPQCSGITGSSPFDYLVPYPGHSFGGILSLCRDAVYVFCSHSWLDQLHLMVRLQLWISGKFVIPLHYHYS